MQHLPSNNMYIIKLSIFTNVNYLMYCIIISKMLKKYVNENCTTGLRNKLAEGYL